jgi:Flp pilus assembly protein TadD
VSTIRHGSCGFLLSLLVAAGCAGAKPAEPAAPAPAPSVTAEQRTEPNGPEVDRAVAAIKAGDFRSAKGALDKALEKNPKNGAALYYLGVTLEKQGDKAGAEQKYKQAIEVAPDISQAVASLAAIYYDRQQYDEAVAVLHKGLAKRPDDPDLHANMGFALMGKGDKMGAVAEFERAVKAGGGADVRLAYGQLLLETGNKDKAASEFRGALGVAGGDRALLATIGDGLGRAGSYAECVAAFDKAIAAGDKAELHVNRGLCRHSLKDEPGAKSDFEAAIKIDPAFAPAHYYLGVSLIASGNNAAAAKEFDAAAAAAARNPDLAKKARDQAQAARKKPAKK